MRRTLERRPVRWNRTRFHLTGESRSKTIRFRARPARLIPAERDVLQCCHIRDALLDLAREAEARELEVVAERVVEIERRLAGRAEAQRAVERHARRGQARPPAQELAGRDLEGIVRMADRR